MDLLSRLTRLRAGTLHALDRITWLPPLLTRLVLAAAFAPTGWGKLHDLPKVTKFFTALGIPAPHFNAVLVGGTELVCGTLLLVGLLSRVAALPLIISMTVALVTAKRDNINGVVDLLGADEFIYIVLLVWIVVAGAGAISLDRLLARRMKE